MAEPNCDKVKKLVRIRALLTASQPHIGTRQRQKSNHQKNESALARPQAETGQSSNQLPRDAYLVDPMQERINSRDSRIGN